ncbi:TetR/AcrR family transcriptional regulator [Nocardioides mesophilus]|uniref:TetR/AcrR family transcriptional regulator n=1 Tax=Nocardioides mesophilus TaxID=433659 RepID=UPI001CB705B4|nr:TetR/AcrR family transcriptional regulator [Nocardioides mesophilus]
MPEPVKVRRYDSTRRRARAQVTRADVLAAARELFTDLGFAATTVADIARRAGVSVDTVYAGVGRKPDLLIAVIDVELAGGGEPVPARERGYVRAIREAATAEAKIRVYADALAALMPRVAPLFQALDQAAAGDADCAEVRDRIDARRAANMAEFVADLRATGSLRAALAEEDAVTLVWSTNSWQYFLLLRSRGVTPAHYADLLTELWNRTLLEP